MKKIISLFIIFSIILFFNSADAKVINFISQPTDSSFLSTLVWQSPNKFHPAILLDGMWEYRTSNQALWEKVVLPAGCQYQGDIFFQRFFKADSTFKNCSFRLMCYGINYYAEVFVNNKFIGSHAGGYTSFYIDIGDDVIFFNQENRIEIKVNTALNAQNSIPLKFQPNSFQETYGIFRSLYLLAVPEMSIQNPKISPILNADFSDCELEIQFNLKKKNSTFFYYEQNEFSRAKLFYQIDLYFNATKERICSTRKLIEDPLSQSLMSISEKLIVKKPHLWTPETPFLYSLQIKISTDKIDIDWLDLSLGVKQFDFFNGITFLNGKQYFIKGINWAENYAISGALFSKAKLIEDLLLIKQLNANALRVINHFAHPYITHACDSLGLLLLQDLPQNSTPVPLLSSEKFSAQIANYLSEAVLRDYLHVSVFAFGLGENYLGKIPQSLSTIADHYMKKNSLNGMALYTSRSPQLCGIKLDSSINVGISVFNLDQEPIRQIVADNIEAHKFKPSFVFSFGAPKYEAMSNVGNGVTFQKYQVQQILKAWTIIKQTPEIDGCFLTALYDYYGKYPSLAFGNTTDPYLRPFGLIDLQNKKRLSFQAIKMSYQNESYRQEAHFDLTNEQPWQFPLAGLLLLILLLFTINSRRYFRENFKRIFIHPHGFYTDLRDGRKIPVPHTLLIAFFVSTGFGLIAASLQYFFKQSLVFDHLLTLLIKSSPQKILLCKIIWTPELAIIFNSLIAMLFFIIAGVLVRLISLITKKSFSIGRSIALFFWMGGNCVIFIPLGIVLGRLLQYQKFAEPIILLLSLIILWLVFRVIKGMRVIFTWTYFRSASVTLMIIAMWIFGVLIYYQHHATLLDYLKLYYSIYFDQLGALSLQQQVLNKNETLLSALSLRF